MKQNIKNLVSTGVLFSMAGVAFSGGMGVLVAPDIWTASIQGIYVFNSRVADTPAIGTITGPVTSRGSPPPNIFFFSSNVQSVLPNLNGGGVHASLAKQLSSNIHYGISYTGYFFNGRASLRTPDSLSIGTVQANIVNRGLVIGNGLNGRFDNGVVDYGRDEFKANKQSLDLLFGKSSGLTQYLQLGFAAGLRGAYADVTRHVYYENTEPSFLAPFNETTDWAKINAHGRMFGIGPAVGADAAIFLAKNVSLNINGLLSGVLASFNTNREESNFSQRLNTTAFQNYQANDYGLVTTADLSFDLSKRINKNWLVGVGYVASVWLAGVKSIQINGYDDLAAGVAPYSLKSNALLTQGTFISVTYSGSV